jgi:outer membrane protein OmpA-like peptidoglycan-associated protein
MTSSIIIQFVFDEISSTSRFLESRIDLFAQWILKISSNPEIESAEIKVLGHTDRIGSSGRNTELSEQRAQKEYDAIRVHLAAMLGLTELSDVDKWLQSKKIHLRRIGLADAQPYIVNKFQNERFEQLLIGDNNYPEGRSINRRVVIEVIENFKGDK